MYSVIIKDVTNHAQNYRRDIKYVDFFNSLDFLFSSLRD